MSAAPSWKFKLATALCRTLPPPLAFRLEFRFFNELTGRDIPFAREALFGSGVIDGNMSDAVDAAFALHRSANLEGMVVASAVLGPGDVVFEFGANLGTETLPLAKLVGEKGRVVAVEAQPMNFAILQQRLRRNRAVQVVALNNAVAAEAGARRVHSGPANNAGMAFVSHDGSADLQRGTPVDAVTADELAERYGAPRLVLMDIEGSEGAALQGCERLLATHRPLLFFEVDDRLLARGQSTPRQIYALLQRHRYAVFRFEGLMMPAVTEQATDGALHTDWLAMPQETVVVFRSKILSAHRRAKVLPKIRYVSPLW